jgi:hypothetical protein
MTPTSPGPTTAKELTIAVPANPTDLVPQQAINQNTPAQSAIVQKTTAQNAAAIADPARRTADILPFPVRPVTPIVEPSPHERLSQALATLNAALTEQRAAIAAWRGALGELKTTATGLGESLQKYRASLGTLGDGVSALHTQAKTLHDWADKVSSTQE